MRKWNLSTHIKRKHPGEFNPLDMLKNIVLTDSYGQSPSSTPPNPTVIPHWRQVDWSDPVQVIGRPTQIQNLVQEISKLSKLEQTSLIMTIFKLQQS